MKRTIFALLAFGQSSVSPPQIPVPRQSARRLQARCAAQATLPAINGDRARGQSLSKLQLRFSESESRFWCGRRRASTIRSCAHFILSVTP